MSGISETTAKNLVAAFERHGAAVRALDHFRRWRNGKVGLLQLIDPDRLSNPQFLHPVRLDISIMGVAATVEAHVAAQLVDEALEKWVEWCALDVRDNGGAF